MKDASGIDLELALKLWSERYDLGWDRWDAAEVGTDVAAQLGLGVLGLDAANAAAENIRQDYRVGGRCKRDRFAQLDLREHVVRWTQHLVDAAAKHPVPKNAYPIPYPDGHQVGTPPCFDRARKGQWTQKCFRAAWGNTEPYGLDAAEKPCPKCGQPMRYWCRGNRGEKAFRWTVDHIVSHSRGGCVCHFNLRAMHRGCNSSKGNR